MTAGQRREMVLQAALIEFAARGLDGTSTQGIAERAGISHPYLFRLFPAKKALFLVVVRRCFQQVTQVLATSAADVRVATQAAFGDLRDAVERLTGLPPARVQRWLGIAMPSTAATAMNLQATGTRAKLLHRGDRDASRH